jgi:hypothetical protein
MCCGSVAIVVCSLARFGPIYLMILGWAKHLPGSDVGTFDDLAALQTHRLRSMY